YMLLCVKRDALWTVKQAAIGVIPQHLIAAVWAVLRQTIPIRMLTLFHLPRPSRHWDDTARPGHLVTVNRACGLLAGSGHCGLRPRSRLTLAAHLRLLPTGVHLLRGLLHHRCHRLLHHGLLVLLDMVLGAHRDDRVGVHRQL